LFLQGKLWRKHCFPSRRVCNKFFLGFMIIMEWAYIKELKVIASWDMFVVVMSHCSSSGRWCYIQVMLMQIRLCFPWGLIMSSLDYLWILSDMLIQILRIAHEILV
jgi:hypothetical protein